MRPRKNRRDQNLAAVSLDKAEEDSSQTSGLFGNYSFFDTQSRKEHKVAVNENSRWVYDLTGENVPNKVYMYAVGQNGALYIGTPTVHSQFKAGKETQSAGWINYQWNDAKNSASIVIDNCSGHYTPSLSQFITTLYGLQQVGFLPNEFSIKLNRFTKVDLDSIDTDFWKDLIKSAANSETSKVVSVKYDADLNGFSFSSEDKNSQLGEDVIHQKSPKMKKSD